MKCPNCERYRERLETIKSTIWDAHQQGRVPTDLAEWVDDIIGIWPVAQTPDTNEVLEATQQADRYLRVLEKTEAWCACMLEDAEVASLFGDKRDRFRNEVSELLKEIRCESLGNRESPGSNTA